MRKLPATLAALLYGAPRAHPLSRGAAGASSLRCRWAVLDRGLLVVALLSLAGAAVKIYGSLVYGSRALLVDAFTCAANIAALAAVLWYLHVSRAPPDEDHPYGHQRLRYGGALASLSAYMFVAGVSAAALAYSLSGYTVEKCSTAAALAGGAFYAAAVYVARGIDPVLRVYAGFTTSELIESGVTVASSWLGASLGYLYDLAGGMIILAYLFHEAVETHHKLMRIFADTAAPQHFYKLVEREALLRGLHPIRVRLRMVDEKHCSGDLIVVPEEGMPPDVADILADELQQELHRHGCDVVIHVGLRERRSSRQSRRSSEKR
ncbi:MAG TPA: hypothetical protein EYH50_03570 [Pyrodictium delaneyi]|uniref:Cation efflux protein transmembrane domain-containing protein n=1 Tax=Pyrodictium delaneyi TaxID=1273541 RepID=A0A833EAZ2_9CREN|nr:hypothetical protein [Pyrodictium delaneyi]